MNDMRPSEIPGPAIQPGRAAGMSTDVSDAACLRGAARILSIRSRKTTFALRVIIRVLQRTADRIEQGGAA